MKFKNQKSFMKLFRRASRSWYKLNVILTEFAVSFAQLLILQVITQLFIKSFNGYVEKFYTNFCKVSVDVEDPFRGLDLNCKCLEGFEIANHVLSYIT